VSTDRATPGPESGPEQEAEGLRVLAVLEAMLFASPEPLSPEEIQAGLPQMPREEIERGLDALARALGHPDRGFRLERVAGGFRLVTRPDLAEPLRALFAGHVPGCARDDRDAGSADSAAASGNPRVPASLPDRVPPPR